MANSRKDEFLKAFLKAEGVSVEYADVDNVVDNNFVKELRKKLKMSQSIFATTLGVTKKTIEKWEQGVNPIKGCSARLLYLIYRNPDIIEQLYKATFYNHTKEFTISIETKNDNNIVSYNEFQEFKSTISNFTIENKFEVVNNNFLKEAFC